MTKFVKIILLINIQWLQSNGNPILFQGISLRKSFDLSFKPLSIGPLTFIKEKWSPLGVFGIKHTIARRDAGDSSQDVVPAANSPGVAVAPVFEEMEPITAPPLVGAVGIAPVSQPVVPSPPFVVPPRPIIVQPEVMPQPVLPLSQEIPPPAVVPNPIFVKESEILPSEPEPEEIQPATSIPVEVAVRAEQPKPVPEVQPIEKPLIEPVVALPPITPDQPVQTVVVTSPITQPAAVESVAIEPVIATPLPPVPIIVPPGVVETPPTPPQLVPLEVEKPSIPGSVLLPPPPGSIAPIPGPSETVPQILMPMQPPIGPIVGAIPTLRDNSRLGPMTDIFRVAPVFLLNSPLGNSILPTVESNSIMEASKGQPESTFVRGSRLALQFGNMLFQLMSKFFSNARVTLDQLTNRPPVFVK